MPFRSHSQSTEPLEDPCTSEDNVEDYLDLEVKEQEEGTEKIRTMEDESAGRSAEKAPGVGDDDGSAAPLPERVIHVVHALFFGFFSILSAFGGMFNV